MWFNNVLNKSCQHLMELRFKQQASQILKVGYPSDFMIPVAEKLLRRVNVSHGVYNTEACPTFVKRNVEIIPYILQVIHN